MNIYGDRHSSAAKDASLVVFSLSFYNAAFKLKANSQQLVGSLVFNWHVTVEPYSCISTLFRKKCWYCYFILLLFYSGVSVYHKNLTSQSDCL